MAPDAAEKFVHKILERGFAAGFKTIGSKTAEILRMEDALVRYGADVDETVTLPEAGLDERLASETKGCYPGQEVVARTTTYKGWQKKLRGLVFQKNILPASGAVIKKEEKEIGRITSACYSPELKKPLAFGYLAKGFFDKSGDVSVEGMRAKTRFMPFGI